ncbi:glycerol-3-phosphate dehydrogenase/oxidase [Sulfurospirillum sp. 1612]|uniref:glycerol-3-phosphate dehydrogenase/oxidase n=1 Tax=Sulfurospirillum sp. 1612 TaxID=3094835 RepID=UPI002F957140
MKTTEEQYDLVIIGGGATGAGTALDATLRGFKCLLLEKNDFAEGTSSRSTKLVHGGVRYLEAAVKKFDKSQFDLVREGLKERYRILHNAPHLAHAMTLVTPLYKWYEIPYIYIGLALYDLISGKRRLGKSRIVSKNEIMKIFPSVKKEGLAGGVRYFDGAFNDSRMAIALLQSAKKKGCVVRNYHEVLSFEHEAGKIKAVRVQDKINESQYLVRADCVINATGVFCDDIRRMDDPSVSPIVEASSGIHILVDKKFLPNEEGLMIPKTEDGRVLFMLPYLDKCLVGTTDEEAKAVDHPEVKEKDIEYLLRHMRKYFSIDIQKSDILSAWSGLRPLVTLKHTADTKELVREHYIEESKSGLITIAGGKWTSYRKMAEDVMDVVQKTRREKDFKKCQTKDFKLFGSETPLKITQEKIASMALETSVKEHLIQAYGTRALDVADFIKIYGAEKLHPAYPYLRAEVYYAVAHEFVETPLDFLVRRCNLGLIDTVATQTSLEVVTGILKEVFAWSDAKYVKKLHEAKQILDNSI